MQRYDSYKPSGVQWLGEIPSHWEVKRLKNVVSYNDDVLLETEKKDKQIKYVEISDVDSVSGIKQYSEYDFKDAPSRARRITRKGDVIVSTVRTYLRAVAQINDDDLIVSTGFAVLRAKKIDKRFLAYYILSDSFISEVIRRSVGTSYPAINANELVSIYLICPPNNEQTAIANYLDTATAKIDAAIAQQQKMIDLLNERKQIIINRAVTKGLNPNAKMKYSGVEWIGEVPEGWGCRKLKSICANTQYSIKTGPFGSQLKGDDIQEFGDVPIYNQRVVIDNDCSLFNSYVSKAKAASLKSFVVNSKDLLITTRGTIGKSTIVPNDAPDGILHPCIIAIRLNFDLCCNEYLQFFFQSIAFNTDMMLKSNATTIEVIYSYNLKECFVPLPPIDEQKQIVEYLNKELVRINQTIDATNNQISLLQERKQIIINEVVTGKVKVV